MGLLLRPCPGSCRLAQRPTSCERRGRRVKLCCPRAPGGAALPVAPAPGHCGHPCLLAVALRVQVPLPRVEEETQEGRPLRRECVGRGVWGVTWDKTGRVGRSHPQRLRGAWSDPRYSAAGLRQPFEDATNRTERPTRCLCPVATLLATRPQVVIRPLLCARPPPSEIACWLQADLEGTSADAPRGRESVAPGCHGSASPARPTKQPAGRLTFGHLVENHVDQDVGAAPACAVAANGRGEVRTRRGHVNRAHQSQQTARAPCIEGSCAGGGHRECGRQRKKVGEEGSLGGGGEEEEGQGWGREEGGGVRRREGRGKGGGGRRHSTPPPPQLRLATAPA